ncbi:MAG: beta-xylosidase [Bacteroidales bacterium]
MIRRTTSLFFAFSVVLVLIIIESFDIATAPVPRNQTNPDTVILKVDLSAETGKMNPAWAWFGYDEPNYTYMKDGKKLLSEIAQLSPVPVYIRTHNLLTSGDGTASLKWGSTNVYTEDKNGNPVYDFTIIDRIFDTFIERGMKPLVELGFMPEALSVGPAPYRHSWPETFSTGWAYPPGDYDKWAELVYQLTKHCISRYGLKEVETWYWEVWNEPNINYWNGSMEEYFKMYDFASWAVKKACPDAIVGGPHTTSPRDKNAAVWLKSFIDHCINGKNYKTGEKGSPLDYIGFHAKGSPKIVDGHVQMNMNLQLQDISKGFEIVSSFPEIRNLPVIIGESDPEGCAACSMTRNPSNSYRNGTLYSSYEAAIFARKYALADYFKINFMGAVTWAFEFEDQRWFDGFRDLATNGVDKPVLNVFRMFGMMSGTRVAVTGGAYDAFKIRDSGVKAIAPDINALASKDKNGVSIMVWNYHDDDVPAKASEVRIEISGLPSLKVQVHEYRIDKNNSNSYEVWKSMGSPQNPTPEQYKTLADAGALKMFTSPFGADAKNGVINLSLNLPRQGVSLFRLTW